jgi:hypothetical protein
MVAVAAATGVLLWPSIAEAQEPQSQRFGERDAFVFSVERILGFQQQDLGERTYDSMGLQPLYWGNVGLFGIWDSGLTFGATFGFTYLKSELFNDDDDGVAIMRVGPRIGYAGSTTTAGVGYWLRGGPSGLFAISDNDSDYAFAASIEAYAVFTPVPHLGILVGPHADFHLFGDEVDGESESEFSSFGLTVGVMGVFW